VIIVCTSAFVFDYIIRNHGPSHLRQSKGDYQSIHETLLLGWALASLSLSAFAKPKTANTTPTQLLDKSSFVGKNNVGWQAHLNQRRVQNDEISSE